MFRPAYKHIKVALLAVGSAALLFSCQGAKREAAKAIDDTLMTENSEHLTIVESENGQKSYQFTTPLLEGYSLAKDPYREFRKGVHIVTYKKDSISSVDATLTANYAISYTKRDLWEAKGNVVVVNSEGRALYTQQLFWNAKTKRIYSNVDTKLETSDGVYYGEGFESDDALKDWRFRRMTGRMEVEVKPAADSLSEDETRPAPPAIPTPGSAPVPAVSVPKVRPSAPHPRRNDVVSEKPDGRLKPLDLNDKMYEENVSYTPMERRDRMIRRSAEGGERQNSRKP